MLTTTDPIGRRVRHLRLQRALSQLDLANKAGLSRSTIVQLERGRHPVHPSTVRLVARALGVKPEQLTVGE